MLHTAPVLHTANLMLHEEDAESVLKFQIADAETHRVLQAVTLLSRQLSEYQACRLDSTRDLRLRREKILMKIIPDPRKIGAGSASITCHLG